MKGEYHIDLAGVNKRTRIDLPSGIAFSLLKFDANNSTQRSYGTQEAVEIVDCPQSLIGTLSYTECVQIHVF